MRLIQDYHGIGIRLTDERRAHILEHPEIVGYENRIVEVLSDPTSVVRSAHDSDILLYYRFYRDTPVGGKYLCVVVQYESASPFVITAYYTDKIKRGVVLWNTEQ